MSNTSKSSNTSSISGCEDDVSQSAYTQLTNMNSDQESIDYKINKEALQPQDRGSYPTPPSEFDDGSTSPTAQYIPLNNINNFNGSIIIAK